MKSFFGLILNLSMTLIVIVNCDIFPQCANVSNPQFIALPDNCSEYIYCDGSDSFRDECPEGYLFNPINSMCDDPINVNCVTAQNQTTLGTTNINPSIATTTQTPASSSAVQTTPPSQSPQTVSTVSTNTSSSPSTTPSGPASICPPSNSNQPENVAKPGSCTEYYLCFNGSPIEMHCPYNLEFSSVSKQCVWANEANCVANPTTTVSPLEVCTNTVNGFFKYPQNCRYYYRCTSGMLTVQECPINYGWDDNRKSCTPTGCNLTN